MDNLSIIARGGGSPQARPNHDDCSCCNPDENVDRCVCGRILQEDERLCPECKIAEEGKPFDERLGDFIKKIIHRNNKASKE